MIPIFCFPLTWLVSLTAELALDYLYCIYICLIVILHMDAYRVVQKVRPQTHGHNSVKS